MQTFEDPTQLAARLTSVRSQIHTLDAEVAELGPNIAAALAAGNDAADLRAQRDQARQLRADLMEAAVLLEQQLATAREQAGVSAAEARMKGIARAYGSIVEESANDEVRVMEAAQAYRDAVQRRNERYRALIVLRAEAGALNDRFGVGSPTLPPVVAPSRSNACLEAARVVADAVFRDVVHLPPQTEHDEHRLRQRRTYGEVASTPAGAIIKAAGLKAWPELTERQDAIVEEREQQRQNTAAEMRRFGVEAERSSQRRSL